MRSARHARQSALDIAAGTRHCASRTLHSTPHSAVASSKNITIPSDLSAADKQLKGRLEKLSGAAFDKEYMAHMVSDHTKDVSQFSREAKTGKDPDVKSFASSTLPVLQEHLTMAQSVDQTVKGSASGESEKGSKKGAKKGSGK